MIDYAEVNKTLPLTLLLDSKIHTVSNFVDVLPSLLM